MTDIKVFVISYEQVRNYRYSITVNEETHHELKGMTEEEMKQYISENAEEMDATNDNYANLLEQLADSDVETSKSNNYDEEIHFE